MTELGPVGRMARTHQLRVAALGGGHGLAATLSALRRIPTDITGIVTVADNGGSSGRLREELDILPPGDLRMALAALCGDDSWGRTWADVLQHRFSSNGPLDGHAVGNLLIAAIWDHLDDHVTGLDLVGQLLVAQGRVLPMAALALDIEADVRLDASPEQLTLIKGQKELATAVGEFGEIRLTPSDPPACPEAIAAVNDADWIVIGPGSWFTSVIPHLLVPQLREALIRTSARKLVVLNLGEQQGETSGLSPAGHLDVLAAHANGLDLDLILADTSMVDDSGSLARRAKEMGAELMTADVCRDGSTNQHDPLRLAAAFQDIMGQA